MGLQKCWVMRTDFLFVVRVSTEAIRNPFKYLKNKQATNHQQLQQPNLETWHTSVSDLQVLHTDSVIQVGHCGPVICSEWFSWQHHLDSWR